MKPFLVVGLGNELMGDDGVGCRVAGWLAHDAGLRSRADFVVAGSDLLRVAGRFEGRERVVLIDAMLCNDEPGTVSVHEEPFDGLDRRWDDAHAPCAVQIVALLKMLAPALRDTSFTLVCIAVPELRSAPSLSARLPEIAACVREALARRVIFPPFA